LPTTTPRPPCDPGTFTNFTSSACLACAPGTFSPDFGSSACKNCGAGFYSGGGVSACTACFANTFANSTGATTCVACGSGSYARGRGSTQCLLNPTTSVAPTTTPTPSTIPPTTTPPAVAIGFVVCCDVIVTFPSSPATAFYGTSFQPQTPDVEYDYGPAVEVAWSTITWVYDATILVLTNATYAPTFAVLNPVTSRYADITRVTLSYRGLFNGTLTVTIADAKNFTLLPQFDDFSLAGQLFRMHCTQEFQSVAFDAEAYIFPVGYAPIDSGLSLTLTNGHVASLSGTTVIGVAPGSTDVLAFWAGFQAVYRNLTVVASSVVFVAASGPDYFFTGAVGQALPLTLNLVQREPDGTLTDVFAFPLPNPLIVTVVAPPSVSLVNGTLVSRANSVAVESVLFSVSSCDGYAPSFEAALVVNLAPAAYDIDLGVEGAQLALVAGEMQVRINAGPSGIEAFFIELSVAAANCSLDGAWTGPIGCTTDDPYGLVQIAGVGQSVPGVIGLVWIFVDDVSGVNIGARVETIGPQHVTLLSTAARFGPGPIVLPPVPVAPWMDLTYAWHQQTLYACLILVHRLRLVESTIAFATDTELSLYVRMTDRTGVPDNNATLVWLYVSPVPGDVAEVWPNATPLDGGVFVPAPLYADGWYGVEYRGFLPNATVSVSVLHSTTVGGVVEPNRTIVFGVIDPAALALVGAMPVAEDSAPYFELVLGMRFSPCPWRAAYASAITLAYEATLADSASYAQLSTAAHVIGCGVSVPGRRVVLSTPQRRGGEVTLGIAIGVESFLRAYDVNLLVLNTTSLSGWLGNLTVLRVDRGGASYSRDAPDPSSSCPAGRYYTGAGTYLALPGHASAGYDCFGYACDEGYMLDAASGSCVPEYVADWVYWTVVMLVTALALTVAVMSMLLRVLMRPAPPPPPCCPCEPEPEPDNTLPIGVTDDGELCWEAEVVSDSGTSSESESAED